MLEPCVRGHLAPSAEASELLRLRPPTTGGRAILVRCGHWTPVPALSTQRRLVVTRVTPGKRRCLRPAPARGQPRWFRCSANQILHPEESQIWGLTDYHPPGALRQVLSLADLPTKMDTVQRLTCRQEGMPSCTRLTAQTWFTHPNIKKAQQCPGKKGEKGDSQFSLQQMHQTVWQ